MSEGSYAQICKVLKSEHPKAKSGRNVASENVSLATPLRKTRRSALAHFAFKAIQKVKDILYRVIQVSTPLEDCQKRFNNVVVELRKVASDAQQTAEGWRRIVSGLSPVSHKSATDKTREIDGLIQSTAFSNERRATTVVNQKWNQLEATLKTSGSLGFDLATLKGNFALLKGTTVFSDFYKEVEICASDLKRKVERHTISTESIEKASVWASEASNALQAFENTLKAIV
ncbi:unnamed protein product [Somion occarium]|uniref:Uncharacterized protein n=1 Tax=Somion occarium TaxID=3059160 RepID=A0ABP1E7T1_9APHY